MSALNRQLEIIYDQYGQQLFTCALAVTRNRENAEDAVHEAFCKCFRLKSIPQNFKAYLFRSVRNAAVDQIRKRRHEVVVSEDFIFESSETIDDKDIGHFKQKVTEALKLLSDFERETIVQHLYADLTFREIAEIMDRPLGTVTSWYRRGLTKLKRHLEKP